jgi:hypothetical protein
MAKELPVLNSKQFLSVEDQSYANIKKYDPAGWAAGKYVDADDPVKIRTALIGKLFDQNLNPLYDVDWQKATTVPRLAKTTTLHLQVVLITLPTVCS